MKHRTTDSKLTNSIVSPGSQPTAPSVWWKRLLWPRWVPAIFGILVVLWLGRSIVGALAGMSEIFKPVFVPLIVSIALAYLIKPLADWIERYKVKRQWAVLIAMGLATIGLCALLLIFIPIGAQLSQTTTKLPAAAKSFSEWAKPRLESLHQRYPAVYEKTADRVMEHLQNPSAIVEPILAGFGSISSNVIKVLGSVLNLVLIPFFVYYILKDTKSLRDQTVTLIPHRHQASAVRLIRQINDVLSSYVRGQLIVCSCMAILYTVAFWSLGVPMAIPLGVLSGFGHLVPYVGTLSAAILTLLLTLLDQPSWFQVILVIVTYPVVQSTEGFVLTPLILGERLELHPFLVIVGLLVAHHLFGILGIILAVPTLAVGKVILEFLMELYEKSDFYQFDAGESGPPTDELVVESTPNTVEEMPS